MRPQQPLHAEHLGFLDAGDVPVDDLERAAGDQVEADRPPAQPVVRIERLEAFFKAPAERGDRRRRVGRPPALRLGSLRRPA